MNDIEQDMIILMAADAVASAVAKRKEADDAERKAKAWMTEVFETTNTSSATASDGTTIALKETASRTLRTVNGGRPSDDNPYIIDVELTREQQEVFYSFKPVVRMYVKPPKK
tara:strand:+ start:145 stop:483 length:339 start_codon:yes stop_codon:yes gene_type:complete